MGEGYPLGPVQSLGSISQTPGLMDFVPGKQPSTQRIPSSPEMSFMSLHNQFLSPNPPQINEYFAVTPSVVSVLEYSLAPGEAALSKGSRLLHPFSETD